MGTVRFVMFLFYRFYKKGKWETLPYFHMLTAMCMLGFINIIAILCFIGKEKLFFAESKEAFLLRLVIFLLGFGLFLFLAAPKKALDQVECPPEKIGKGNLFLILYIIASFALMVWSFTLVKGR